MADGLMPTRRRAWLDLISVFSLFFAGLWLVGPNMGSGRPIVLVYWLMVTVGAVVILRPCPWGFGRERPRIGRPGAGWPVYVGGTAVATVALCAAALAWRHDLLTRLDAGSIALKFVGYLVFAAIQATAFFYFVQPRVARLLERSIAEESLRRGAVAGCMGLLLAVVHAPNPAMMALTLAGGVFWSWAHSRWPNLWLVVLSHAVLGTTVHRVLLINTRVGPFYARPDQHILQNAIPGLHEVFGNLF